MRWKISVEGSDEITRGHRFQFEIERSLDDLIAGSVGLSIEEGKAILASLLRHIGDQVLDYALEFDQLFADRLTARDLQPLADGEGLESRLRWHTRRWTTTCPR